MSNEKAKDYEQSVSSMYAIIPAPIMRDKTLRPNAKLIYGEISTLTHWYGYCFSSNQYFADIFDIDRKTVSALISSLVKAGYITVEICYVNGSSEVDERKIWLNANFKAVRDPIHKNVDTHKNVKTPPQKRGDPIHKNVEDNIININNNTPIVPRGDAAQFEKFWAAYPRKIDKQKACRVFWKINPNEKLLGIMLAALDKQKRSPQWTKDGGAFIPYPTTWLNNRRWEAEEGEAKSTTSKRVVESDEVNRW